MKMRVLYSTSKGKIKTIAQLITDKYATEKVNCMDSIPPAYSCDKERLVVMLVSTGKDPANALILFCKELTKARAANVAFIIDGPADGAKVLVNAVKDLLGIHSPSTVFADIGKNLVLGMLNGISGIWGRITDFFSSSLNTIKQKFSDTDTWNSVKNSVSGAFASIRDSAASIWNGIIETVRGAVNSVLGFINRMISGIANGLNGAIDALNSLSFDAPDWLGGGHFGFNIRHVPVPQIPYLAQGAVIPPNKEFLAVLGDQSHGTNVEAPLATIQQAVADVMRDNLDGEIAELEAIRSTLLDILEAVYGIDFSKNAVGHAVDRYQTQQAIITGRGR